MRRSGILKQVTKVFSHPIASVGLSAVGGMVAERLADQSGLVDALTNTGMGALKVLGIGPSKAPDAPAAPSPAVEALKATDVSGVSPVIGGAASHVEPVVEEHGELNVGCGVTACAPCAAKAAAAAAAATPAPAPVDVGAVAAKKSELEGKMREVFKSSPAFREWADEAKAAGFSVYAPFIVASSEVTPQAPVGDVPEVGTVLATLKYPNCGPKAGQEMKVAATNAGIQAGEGIIAQYTAKYCPSQTHHSAATDSAYKKAQATITELQKEKNSWHSKWMNEKNAAQKAQYQQQINALDQQLALAQSAQAAIYTNPLVAQQIAATAPTDLMSVMQQMMQMKMFEQMLAPQAAAPAPVYAAPPPAYGYPPPPSPYGSPYAVDAYGQPAVYAPAPQMYADPTEQYEAMDLMNQGIDPSQAASIDPGLTGPSELTGGESFDDDLAYSLEGVQGYEGADPEEELTCIPCGG